jgi:S1-C subfamily serine protease
MAQDTETGQWKVVIALVLDDLEVRPVPLHAFVLRSVTDSTFEVPARTALDGTAEGLAPVGGYVLESNDPARLNGVAYTWSVPFHVNAVGVAELELTHLNATIDSTIALELKATGRKVEDAVVAYQQVRASVFRVESGAGHGTGFLVDSAQGLVITNAHVIEHQTRAYVVLDSVSRARVGIVHRDPITDLAVLQVNPYLVSHLHPLTLAHPQDAQPVVEQGERVFAVGFPLDQEQTLTTGIVSSVRDGAIISDVNINPGNSGGPMLNYSAEVVGVNTFANVSDRGPGISGAIAVESVRPVLAAAWSKLDSLPTQLTGFLPTMPLTTYRLEDLHTHTDTASSGRLKEYTRHDVGPFDLSFQTPPALILTARALDEEIAGERRRNESDVGIEATARYSSVREFRDWYRFASELLAPVVMLQVVPQVGETTGSLFTRVLVGTTKQTMKFKGDVTDVIVYRNGRPVEPLRGGSVPVEQYIDNQWVSLKDVANFGSYVFSPMVFAPDTLGTPPSIVLEVLDLKDDNRSRCRELPKKLVAYLWNDFLPFLRAEYPEREWTVANRDHRPKEFQASGLPGDTVFVVEPKKAVDAFGGCPRRDLR